jgi:hypothetical protein
VAGALAVIYAALRFDRHEREHSPAGVARLDRELLHDERMYAMERQFDIQEKIVDAMIGVTPHARQITQSDE